MFKTMKDKELRAWIDGARQNKEFDTYFEQAICELNARNDARMQETLQRILPGRFKCAKNS